MPGIFEPAAGSSNNQLVLTVHISPVASSVFRIARLFVMSADDTHQLEDGTEAGKKTMYLQEWEDCLDEYPPLRKRGTVQDIAVHFAESERRVKDVLDADITDIAALADATAYELELDNGSAADLSIYLKKLKRQQPIGPTVMSSQHAQ